MLDTNTIQAGMCLYYKNNCDLHFHVISVGDKALNADVYDIRNGMIYKGRQYWRTDFKAYSISFSCSRHSKQVKIISIGL